MANFVTRRLLNRSLFKLKEFSQISRQIKCTSIFFIKTSHNSIIDTITYPHKPFQQSFMHNQIQLYSTHSDCKEDEDESKKKPSLFQRFKQMYKDYWYVLVPVHIVTSAAWYGGFYYMAKSGVDIVALLESWHVSEKITNPLKDSSMGYLAVAYALYKIATPARYTVTLGGTTISINYLKKWGYIKPVPSKERLKEIYHEQKDNLLETMRETREGLKIQSEKLKDKKENIIDDFDQSIKKIKELGDKMKSKDHTVDNVKKKVAKSSKE